MKRKSYGIIGLFFLVFLSVACSKDSDSPKGAGGDSPDKPQPRNRINWESVAPEYNPNVGEFDIQAQGAEKINLDLFGFDDDVEVVYSKDIPEGSAALRVFTVWKKRSFGGSLDVSAKGNQLNVRYTGGYQCSIGIRNGQITDLDGGCIIRAILFLNTSAKVEVYNLGQLITKRFIPMDNETFFKELKAASFADDKFTVVENYLQSYKITKTTPSLQAKDLEEALDQFYRSAEKFKALRMLHMFVADRNNLESVIEDQFGHFERDEARRIVGL